MSKRRYWLWLTLGKKLLEEQGQDIHNIMLHTKSCWYVCWGLWSETVWDMLHFLGSVSSYAILYSKHAVVQVVLLHNVVFSLFLYFFSESDWFIVSACWGSISPENWGVCTCINSSSNTTFVFLSPKYSQFWSARDSWVFCRVWVPNPEVFLLFLSCLRSKSMVIFCVFHYSYSVLRWPMFFFF